MNTTVGAQQSQESVPASRVQVGTFDSRALAIAYYRSESFSHQVKEMRAAYEKAKKAGDEKRVRELEIVGSSQQELMHKQGFSAWQVDNILKEINGELPKVAKQADVDIIISKWATVYQQSGVEFIDVTNLIVKLFDPDEQTLKMIEEIQNQAPVPLEDLRNHPE